MEPESTWLSGFSLNLSGPELELDECLCIISFESHWLNVHKDDVSNDDEVTLISPLLKEQIRY